MEIARTRRVERTVYCVKDVPGLYPVDCYPLPQVFHKC
jgi:hypothetical protein